MEKSIPERCTVLVVGGGPAGSYTACALAREGIDTVLLEADSFPRYHIGESMLASFRHFLRFIDLESTFDNHGFTKKVGAAFKLNSFNREGYTDFLAAAGPNGHTWNCIRSEMDDLLFKHTRTCGATSFDQVKVTDIKFSDEDLNNGAVKRPIAASWTSRAEGSSGTIFFDYLVDATGRAGIMSTKYLKNRVFNDSLKNIANWGYWKGAGSYGVGTAREGVPYIEALRDESGWSWFIPLHDGTVSVGFVQSQLKHSNKKKTSNGKSTRELYLEALDLAPNTKELIGAGTLAGEVKQASDFSYQSSTYAGPYFRVVGDAGAFIDPFFSSGVHLALTSGLSAATTICSSIRGFDEAKAGDWHNKKTKDGYIRFLLAVLSAYKQMLNQDTPVLHDFDEADFDRAFAMFRPIISGTTETDKSLTMDELSKTVDFCSQILDPGFEPKRAEVLDKLKNKVPKSHKMHSGGMLMEGYKDAVENGDHDFTEEDVQIIKQTDAGKMIGTDEWIDIRAFSGQAIDGYAPLLERGRLGLVPVRSEVQPTHTEEHIKEHSEMEQPQSIAVAV